MAGNYLSVIVLFSTWQDAGGGATTAPLIRHRHGELQGEERKSGRGNGRERQNKAGVMWEKNERNQEKKRDMMIFVNHTNAIESKSSTWDGTEASAIQQAKPSFLRSSLASFSL